MAWRLRLGLDFSLVRYFFGSRWDQLIHWMKRFKLTICRWLPHRLAFDAGLPIPSDSQSQNGSFNSPPLRLGFTTVSAKHGPIDEHRTAMPRLFE